MRDLNVNFSFNDNEKNVISEAILKIDANPYKFYTAFRSQIRETILVLPEIARLREYLNYWRSISTYENPFIFLDNCPIDLDIPVFGNDDPVKEKYDKKKTFISEGFLQIYTDLSGQYAISYLNVNDGDVFQDIFPKEDLKYSQSQKALGPICFHKDLANHFVRPDFVNILALRSSNDNHVYTTFVSNRDILENLSSSTKELLRQKLFHTPYDDLSLNSKNVHLGKADEHPILSSFHDMRLFENRTKGLNQEAEIAIDEILHLAHQHKKKVLMKPGDFVGISNNLGLHGKELGETVDEIESRKRYSIKTVNVYHPGVHMKYFVKGTDYLVKG